MAKRKIIWSFEAKSDLYNVLNFYYRRNGTWIYSKKLNSAFRKSVRLLTRHPEIGIQTDIFHIRILIIGDFKIFYKIKQDSIVIITIIDTRQDPDKLILK